MRAAPTPPALVPSPLPDQVAAETLAPKLSESRPQPQPQPQPAPDRAQGGDAWLASSYLDASQLDQAPRPVAGWFLDEEALQALPHTIMQLRLKVSATGRIDHVEVLRAEPPGEWVLTALRPLRETPMRAGVLGGRAVDATLVVELATDNEGAR